MKPVVRAKIQWKEAQNLPKGKIYSTAARLGPLKDQWPNVAWSLVIKFLKKFDKSLSTVAEVEFLSPEAPAELLANGCEFDLFEGGNLVATGKVYEVL